MGTDNKVSVLGIGVDVISRERTLELVKERIDKKQELMQVVTAYSEFFVAAQKDLNFRKVLVGADLVLPDGVGPLAAIRYARSIHKDGSSLGRILSGLETGFDILTGNVGLTVPGVWLFKRLIEKAVEEGWKVFLLGGYGETVQEVARKLKENYPRLKVGYDAGEQNINSQFSIYNLQSGQNKLIKKINEFKPDLLFVAYGPVKQEKWIYANKNKLKVKVVVGVGGTFNEVLGRTPAAPKLLEKAGLKWLWRLILEPKRIGRIWQAVVVFPWLVFRKI